MLLIALPPRRPLLLAIGIALAVALFTGRGGDAWWYAERGWVLVLSAWFVLTVVVWPRARFLPRALLAVTASGFTAGLLFWLNRDGFARLDMAVAARIRQGASEAVASWMGGSSLQRVATDLETVVYDAADLQAMLYPALLALASVAALAVAWWAYRRLAVRDLSPLGRLRDFRFNDGLAWVLIAGGLLLLLPLNDPAARTGSNLLAFMVALYALRGVAVLLVIGGVPGPLGIAFGALAVLFLYPLVMATAVLVGLSDTWLDIRTRRRVSSDSGS